MVGARKSLGEVTAKSFASVGQDKTKDSAGEGVGLFISPFVSNKMTHSKESVLTDTKSAASW